MIWNQFKRQLSSMQKKRNKIIQFSPPRSGSTLVTNILKEIFPSKTILKTHVCNEEISQYPVVVTYRHPLDCIASSIQAYELSPTDSVIEDKILGFERYGIWEILKIKNSSNVLMLQYEIFFNNFEVIYSGIEDFFNINIPLDKKNEITQKYDVNKIKTFIDKAGLSSFQEYDNSSLWHGNHISKYQGKPGYYKDFFTREQIEYLKSIYHQYLLELSYK